MKCSTPSINITRSRGAPPSAPFMSRNNSVFAVNFPRQARTTPGCERRNATIGSRHTDRTRYRALSQHPRPSRHAVDPLVCGGAARRSRGGWRALRAGPDARAGRRHSRLCRPALCRDRRPHHRPCSPAMPSRRANCSSSPPRPTAGSVMPRWPRWCSSTRASGCSSCFTGRPSPSRIWRYSWSGRCSMRSWPGAANTSR